MSDKIAQAIAGLTSGLAGSGPPGGAPAMDQDSGDPGSELDFSPGQEELLTWIEDRNASSNEPIAGITEDEDPEAWEKGRELGLSDDEIQQVLETVQPEDLSTASAEAVGP